MQPPEAPPGAPIQPPRTRPLDETPELALRAVELLRTPSAIVQLSADEARQVVAFMRLVRFPVGAVVFQAGVRVGAGFMLLLLEGQMSVEAGDAASAHAVPISVIGAGSTVGEMSLLDGAPHSATCTAASPVVAAGLSRGGLERLIEEHPRIATKLLVGLAHRIADRLRDLGDQLQIYAQLNASLEAEVGRLRGGAASRN